MLVPVGVSIVPALLMVTSVRFRSFRGLLSPRTSQARATTAVLAAALVVGLVLDPATTGLVVACTYLLTAPLGVVTAPLRAEGLRRAGGGPAAAPDAVGVPADHRRRRLSGMACVDHLRY